MHYDFTTPEDLKITPSKEKKRERESFHISSTIPTKYTKIG